MAILFIITLGAMIHAAAIPLGAPMAPWIWWLVAATPFAALKAFCLPEDE